MDELPILRFDPIYKQVVWGGRRLGPLLDRRLPGDEPIGESWELVDLPADQSAVARGPLTGTTLGELRRDRRPELMGDVSLLEGRFPLLLKFIDAVQTLSVQVHPDEDACARIGGGARPKTEAWYVIDREPDAALYVGLRPGVDRSTFAAAISDGEVEPLLHRLAVEPGDFVFLPAGTVHAIGQGIVLAEVQQSSDTTYRVFDWNRVGLDGRPRQLHVEQALKSIDYGQVGPPEFQRPRSGRDGVCCDSFAVELVRPGPDTASLKGQGPLALMGVFGDGSVTARAGSSEEQLALGQTLLVPAAASGKVELSGAGELSLLAVRATATGG
jgi:mannose-6-phosphate isomerase